MSASNSVLEPKGLQDYLTYRIATLAQMINRDSARITARHWNLSLPKYRVLAILGASPDISLRDLTLRAHMDKGQISRVVTEMEKDGLLLRTPDTNDGRRLLLKLSAEGARLFAQTTKLTNARQHEIMSALEPEELQVFYSALEKLSKHMRKRLNET